MTRTTRLTFRPLRSCVATALFAAILASAGGALAAVDLTGNWKYRFQYDFGLTDMGDMTAVQSGTTLTIDVGAAVGAMTGTIDPVTGTFDVTSPWRTPTGPFGPCEGIRIGGTVTPDGNSMSGRGEVLAQGGPFSCGPLGLSFTADRDLCGNGVIDAGEACDDGNRASLFDCCSPTCQIKPAGSACRFSSGACDPGETCDGVSSVCPANQVSPAGTACRAPAGACDVGETCNGVNGFCPPDTGPPDADGDGVGDPCDACPRNADERVLKPRLTLASYDGVDGNDKLVLKAEIPLSSTAAAFLDPASTGVQVDVGSLEVVLPAGAYSAATRHGWKTAASGRSWAFRGTDPLLAVSSATIKLASHKSGSRAIVKLTGKKRTFADTLPGMPLSLHLVLDPPVATSMSCGAGSFAADGGPSPACTIKAKNTALSCH